MPTMPLYHIVVFFLSITCLTASGCGIADKIREVSSQSKALASDRNVGDRTSDASANGSGDGTGDRNSGDGNSSKCGQPASAPEARMPENPFGLEGVADVTYEGSIKGMINSKCAWCHSPTASRPRTPYLTTYDEVKGQGTAVYQAMTDRGDDRMPPRFVRPQLSSDDVRLFAAWRDGGYKKGTPPPPPNPAIGIFYINDIKSLMANQCVGCHGPGAISPDLTSYASVKAAANSALAAMQNGSMPKAGPLPSTQIAAFKSWVDAKMPYAKDNATGTGAPAAGTPPPPAPGPSQDPSRPEDKDGEHQGECAS